MHCKQQGGLRVCKGHAHLEGISLPRSERNRLIWTLFQAVHPRPMPWGHPLSPKQLKKDMCVCSSPLKPRYTEWGNVATGLRSLLSDVQQNACF